MTVKRTDADRGYRISFVLFVIGAWNAMYPGTRFDKNWHIEAICWALRSLYSGRKKPRLIINMPPRSLKSFIVSVCLPAWLLGIIPDLTIIVASYSDELSRKFSRDCRALMETPFYRRVFPKTKLSARKTSESEFETTKRGCRLATSVGGTLTGRGADLLIVDDPLKAQDTYSDAARAKCIEWFDSTAMSRLNEPHRSNVVVVMQRLHANDLSGYLLEKGWPSLVLPATATKTQRYMIGDKKYYTRRAGELLQPKRDRLESLEQIKRDHGSHIFAAQYQQDPVPPDGNLVNSAWLKWYDKPPAANEYDALVLTVDPAGKTGPTNDYTAIVVAGILSGNVYILHVTRGHWDVLDMRNRINELVPFWGVREVIVEDTASGMGLVDVLCAEARFSTKRWSPKGDKVTRLCRHQAKFECGQVVLSKEAHWLAEFLRELMAFPNGKYDDQVDALLLLLDWYSEMKEYLSRPKYLVFPDMSRPVDRYDRFSNMGPA